MSTPWWYSGSSGPDAERRLPNVDFTLLAHGAHLVVDLARGALFAGHEAHERPQEHPTCLLCRAQEFMADVGVAGERPAGGRRTVEWLLLDD